MEELVLILFDDKYFSFFSNAVQYVDKIFDFVIVNIHTFPHKNTPKKLLPFGTHYIFYKSNGRTTWFIFFEKLDENYFVTGILNNHCEEAQFI